MTNVQREFVKELPRIRERLSSNITHIHLDYVTGLVREIIRYPGNFAHAHILLRMRTRTFHR